MITREWLGVKGACYSEEELDELPLDAANNFAALDAQIDKAIAMLEVKL